MAGGWGHRLQAPPPGGSGPRPPGGPGTRINRGEVLEVSLGCPWRIPGCSQEALGEPLGGPTSQICNKTQLFLIILHSASCAPVGAFGLPKAPPGAPRGSSRRPTGVPREPQGLPGEPPGIPSGSRGRPRHLPRAPLSPPGVSQRSPGAQNTPKMRLTTLKRRRGNKSSNGYGRHTNNTIAIPTQENNRKSSRSLFRPL